MKIKFICPCGKNFYLTPGQIRPGHGKYCCRDCYYKYRPNKPVYLKGTHLGENSYSWKGNNAKYAALHLRV